MKRRKWRIDASMLSPMWYLAMLSYNCPSRYLYKAEETGDKESNDHHQRNRSTQCPLCVPLAFEVFPIIIGKS
jgi:hypothetical protein